MATGQVTDADLATGLKGFGGLGTLGGSPGRPVRDNPFCDTQTEPPRPVVVAPVIEPVPETPKLEVLTTGVEPECEGKEAAPAVVAAPLKVPQPQPAAAPRPPKKIAPASPAGDESADALVRENKTEIYTERVMVLLNAELRDEAEALAKELHRRRTRKGERITTNTVMRVALRVLLERMEEEDIEGTNSEGELLAAVRSLYARRRGG
jgi:hypothetical protein